MNEFYGNDNKIGILTADPDPINYFSIEHKEYKSDPTQALTMNVVLDNENGGDVAEESDKA